MTSKNSITVIEELGKLLREESGDLLRASVEKLYNVLMELEAETIVCASKINIPLRETHILTAREILKHLSKLLSAILTYLYPSFVTAAIIHLL